MRKIDLIATFGSSQILSPSFDEMVKQGLDMVRLNCSHLSVDELQPLITRLKEAKVRIMLDLPGYEIRLQGPSENTLLEAGQTVHLGKSPQGLCGNFDAWGSLNTGMEVFIQGTEIQAQISTVYPDAAELKIIKGGILRPNASISFAGLDATNLSSLDPDLPYLNFAIKQEVDIVVLSHINHPNQVRSTREHLKGSNSLLCTKIETKAALDHLDELIDLSDLMLLGRGDLSASIPFAHVPIVQRELTRLCKAKGKPLYIATGLLSSLAYQDAPSHSNVADIATAIMDGANGFILTNETATSADPNSVLATARQIVSQVQQKLAEKTLSPFIRQDLDLEKLLAKLAEIGSCIWQRGWAEANAGNVSIRLTDYGTQDDDPVLFLVSKTGSRYRQFGSGTMDNFVLIEVRGDQYRCLDPQSKPTSEWNAHLNLHRHFRQRGLDRRVVLHSHPDEVICLSHQAFIEDKEVLYQELASSLTELPLFLDTGIHVCSPYPPGSEALAAASISGLKAEKALIWSKHGLLTFGSTLDEAFDYMEVLVKAAKILLNKIPSPNLART